MIGIWIAATVETRITQNGPQRLVFIEMSQWSIADGSGFNEKRIVIIIIIIIMIIIII